VSRGFASSPRREDKILVTVQCIASRLTVTVTTLPIFGLELQFNGSLHIHKSGSMSHALASSPCRDDKPGKKVFVSRLTVAPPSHPTFILVRINGILTDFLHYVTVTSDRRQATARGKKWNVCPQLRRIRTSGSVTASRL
jgi:hypothetical protein